VALHHGHVVAIEPFESFRRVVFSRPELEARLRSISDWPSFVAAVVEAAAEHAIVLTDADVLAARDEARRSWLARWV
jgi:hypothetical protein